MDILNFKYQKIKNFFSKEEINILKKYCRHKHIYNTNSFNTYMRDGRDISNNHDTYFYKDSLMEVFLREKKYIVEQTLNLKLFSAYSFWKCYTYGAILEQHTDRPSCEFSVTAFIDADKKDWPIYMEDKPIYLDSGDAVIYKGTEVPHGRKMFDGDYHIQTFLHYVNQEGPYKNFKGDNQHT